MTRPSVSQWRSLEQALAGTFGTVWVSRVTTLLGGVSSATHCLELTGVDGLRRKFVVKLPQRETVAQKRNSAEAEYRTLEALRGSAVAAPEPRLLDRTGAILSSPGLVLDYLPGAPDLAPKDLPGALVQIAQRLVDIHALPLERVSRARLPARRGSVQRLIHAAPPILDHGLREPIVRAALKASWSQLGRVQPCLLHGDYWPGNLLWDNGVLVGVLDWEEAETGDPLADLAIARLDILWAFGWEAMHAFTNAYSRLTYCDTGDLAVWDLVAALRPMSRLATWASALWSPPIARPDLSVDVLATRHRLFVDQAMKQL